MEGDILFQVDTVMAPEDNRSFLYLATFRMGKGVYAFLLILSLIGACLLAAVTFGFRIKPFFLCWLLMFMAALATMFFKIEHNHKQRLKTDRTGMLGSTTTMSFFEDAMVMETNVADSKSTIMYEQFYSLVESKAYFIFYLNMNRATLLRKKDMADIDMASFRSFITKKFEGKYKKI